MDSRDRYVLAVAVLEGDRVSRLVLGDLLEEQGERNLAQWAREGRNRPRMRIAFGLHMLPLWQAVVYVCECVEHEFSEYLEYDHARTLGASAQAWCDGALDAAALQGELLQRLGRLREAMRQSRPAWMNVTPIAQSRPELALSALNQAIEEASFAERRQGAGQARQMETVSRQSLRRGLELAEGTRVPRSQWQIEHLKQTFLKLLAAEK